MSNRIRVMHVSHVLDMGGVEKLLYTFAKYNSKDKYELAFVTTKTKEGFISSKIENMGYKVYRLLISTRVYDLRIIPKLITAIKDFNPHVIHFYTKISILGCVAAWIAKVPIKIINEIDMDWDDWNVGLKIAAAFKKKSYFFVDKILASSNAVRKYWDDNESDKFYVIYEPFDMPGTPAINSIHGINSYKNGKYPVIGNVSRIFYKKGHKDLIEALPKIVKTFPSVRVNLIGTGPLMPKMKELVISLGLKKNVYFKGFVSDLSEELKAMDLFVFPTLTEAFPLSVMEAMAFELPVAASNVGGIPEMILHGETGLLFPVGNSNAITNAVITILSDMDKSRQMGKKGKERVNTYFSPEIYMKKLDSLYTELIASKKVQV